PGAARGTSVGSAAACGIASFLLQGAAVTAGAARDRSAVAARAGTGVGLEYGPAPKSRQDLVFGAVHGSERVGCSIVVPAQVQQPVQGVQEQLAFHRNVMVLGPPPCLRDTYNHF